MVDGLFRRTIALCIAGLALLWAAHAAAADVVTEWGERAIALGAEKQLPTSRAIRALAMTHVAMFEAINAIDRRYKPYKLDLDGHPQASRDAAASAAAHAVLVGLFPEEKAKFDQALQASLAALPEGDAKARGIELGRKARAGILALRADDGSTVPESYRPHAQAGVYVPTALPAEITTGRMMPWIMTSGDQFRPAPPPALSSDVWTRDVNEIRELGSLRSQKRTPQQTEMARFWFLVGARTFVPLVHQAADARKLDLVDRARLHALVAMAVSDALIAVFDAKYAYNFWRPITAIRNADLSGNAATPRDAAWTPLGATPMHPEYPCAHCIVASTVAEVLMAAGGADVGELTLTSALSPGVTRRWKRLEEYRDEVSEARTLAGFHYRFSNEVGNAMGKKIGALTAGTTLLAAGAKITKQ